ncbi:unnamed protein product [Ixodes pacificus]
MFQTSKRSQRGMLEINERFVYALRTCGKGLQAGRVMCAVLNMPPPPRKFASYTTRLLDAAATVVSESMARACEKINDEKHGSDEPQEIAVTVDETWMKRGHSSLHGVVTLISADTGKVLDSEVETKFCHVCARKQHTDSNQQECKVTHSG